MLILPETIYNKESKQYSIVRLNKNNLGDLKKLHAAVYGVQLADDYFQKKYDTAYTGIEDVGFIGYNTDKLPVAYYGVIPCFLQYEKSIMLVAQSADTMTHPQHRNKGMFIKLSVMTFDLCRQLGITLIFGFPNQNSYPAMIKHLGWIETEKMSRFVIPVRNLFSHRRKNHEAILEELLLPKKGIPNSVIEEGYGGVYRDKAFYQYKAFTKTYVIKISSGDVWIKINKNLIVGDIMLTGNKDQVFFDEIKELAKKLHLNKVSFQVCSGCHLHDLFARHSKAISSFPVLFKDFGSGLPLEKIKFTFADIDIF